MTFKVLKRFKNLKKLTQDTGYLEGIASQFDVLAVDEYQDLNATERELIELLAEYIPTVLIVGDDLQCIYSYKGSDINAMGNLKIAFPDAYTIPKTKSYRLTEQNAAFTNEILKHNGYPLEIIGMNGQGPRPRIVMSDSRNQKYRQAAKDILKLMDDGVDAKDIAVLSRYNYSLETFVPYLQRQHVPSNYSKNENIRKKILKRLWRFLRAVIAEINGNNSKPLINLLVQEARIKRKVAERLTDTTAIIPA